MDAGGFPFFNAFSTAVVQIPASTGMQLRTRASATYYKMARHGTRSIVCTACSTSQFMPDLKSAIFSAFYWPSLA